MSYHLKALMMIYTVFFLTLPSFPQDKNPPQEKQDQSQIKFTSLHKSLLIPGWGQMAEKHYVEGALFLSSEIFCFYHVFSYNHKGNRFYDKYKGAHNVGDATRFRELTEKYDRQRNIYLLAATGIWVINLIDIYFIYKNRNNKENHFRLFLQHDEDKWLVLGISYRF